MALEDASDKGFAERIMASLKMPKGLPPPAFEQLATLEKNLQDNSKWLDIKPLMAYETYLNEKFKDLERKEELLAACLDRRLKPWYQKYDQYIDGINRCIRAGLLTDIEVNIVMTLVEGANELMKVRS